MTSPTQGTHGIQANSELDYSSPVLNQVRQATTIEGGISAMRTGIANQLLAALGPQITGMTRNPGDYPQGGHGEGGGTGGAQSGIPPGLDIQKLNQLYMGLVTEDEAWSEALTANTPYATGEQEAGSTASRTAFA